ncbi:hypothetical protein J1N09_12000 [Aureitalea sp. L0-47]|uniref:hypothetical protein n=1 Tax=Aureitalea sp. L0-47 TaxID=2816962 RepID=UPI002238B15A|nr:hypothetical protein [Aureitalea sp. L0-47]MCW5520568.1 hypothetical protein [Aureitalea sp. L0-47]
MKTKYLLLLLTLFFATSNISSQDILGGIQQVAAMENEESGVENSNEGSDEVQQQAEDWWDQEVDENAAFLAGLEDPDEKCIAMLMIWAHGYQKLKNETHDTADCKRRYDLYGMQILSLTAGNTMIYCTEDLYNYGEDDLGVIAEKFFDNYFENIGEYIASSTPDAELRYDGYGNKAFFAKKLHWVLDNFNDRSVKNNNLSHSTSLYLGATLMDILNYLEPYNYIHNVALLGRAMDELGCGG